MSSNWDGQYDAFQGQSGGFYDPTASQYNYGDASAGNSQPAGNPYPNFMTPADPYSPVDQGNLIVFIGRFHVYNPWTPPTKIPRC